MTNNHNPMMLPPNPEFWKSVRRAADRAEGGESPNLLMGLLIAVEYEDLKDFSLTRGETGEWTARWGQYSYTDKVPLTACLGVFGFDSDPNVVEDLRLAEGIAKGLIHLLQNVGKMIEESVDSEEEGD